MDMIKEKILCAAIYLNDGIKREGQPKNIDLGFVVTGRRHHNCYATLQAVADTVGMKEILKNQIERIDIDHQGFITSSDRYVDRKEGFKIAKSNNQIFHKIHDNNDEGILISEDLY